MNIIAVDWGKDIRKRSAYRAEVSTRVISQLEFDGRLTHLVEYAATLEGPVLIGIDAAIGFPRMAWNRLTRGETDSGSTFVDYLLGGELPDRFFDPIQTPEEWSPARPFVKPGAGSWSLTAFIESSKGGFYRQIDRRLNGNPIFVTSGIPGSVGSGTRALWRELRALASESNFNVWPFHGFFDQLMLAEKPIVAEIYPKACYGIALTESLPSPLVSIAKTRHHVREDTIAQLMGAEWVTGHEVAIQDIRQAIANEDDFDALFSAAALLRIVLEDAPIENQIPEGLSIEGGVLGSASIQAGKQRTQPSRSREVEKAPTGESNNTRQYPCPIRGCKHTFQNSRGGWDAHVASLKRHPNWNPEITAATQRKQLFKKDFADWFLD
jgi:hypothetical protein